MIYNEDFAEMQSPLSLAKKSSNYREASTLFASFCRTKGTIGWSLRSRCSAFADIRRQFRLRRNRPNQRGCGVGSPCWGRWHGVPEGLTDRPAPPPLCAKRSKMPKSAKGGIGGKQEFFPLQQRFRFMRYPTKTVRWTVFDDEYTTKGANPLLSFIILSPAA